MIYGYCRISRKQQSIDRQIRNILQKYPDTKIYQEAYTGTRLEGRTEWKKLYERVVKEAEHGYDVTIVFDSVSRMSRNAEEGIQLYFELFDKGVNLVFLKEEYINTEVYAENMKDKLELTGTDEDEIFKGLNSYFRKLAKRQIKIAFEQSEKEVLDLRQRTREGIVTAKINGKQIGQKSGSTITTKKSIEAKKKIRKYSKDFEGSLSDIDCMELIKITRNTYYKYKRELKDELLIE